FSSGAGRTSDGNGSHASTLKSPSYTKSVSWQHYQHPEAFILVTSAEKFIVDGNCIQLIGIGNEQGEFDFYRQIYPVTGGEHKVEALMWTHLPA
ncbi:hypothetical protein, partial [Escherichia coli]|uniref:hypothetical protein n=1 Tax=Escherichia coli TaxID=562 RepID=UPI0011196DBC